MSDQPSFEDSLLANQLTEVQLDALVLAFVKSADVNDIAAELSLPKSLILRALDDDSVSSRALAAKRGAALPRFLGLAMDQLLTLMASPLATCSVAEKLAAMKMLRDLLGLRPTERLAPKPTAKKKADPEPKPPSFEALLRAKPP